MKRISLLLIALMLVTFTVTTDAGSDKRFRARLTGAEQVPPTNSEGTARINFTVNTKFGGLYYEINVSNLHNVRASHIHLAPRGAEGPIAAVLLSGVTTRSATRGRIHVGIVMPADLVGPLERSRSLKGLLDQIRAGNAYACIHTRDGSGGGDQRPGNFVDGEVRGQIQ